MALHRLTLAVDDSSPDASPAHDRSFQCEHGLSIAIDGRHELGRWDGTDVPANSLLQETSPLIPPDDGAPIERAVQWCGCGEAGCGSLVVVIRREGSTVVWSDFRDDPSGTPVAGIGPFTFDADEYVLEVRRAHRERDWESRDHRVARLLGDRLADLFGPDGEGSEFVATWSPGEVVVAVMEARPGERPRRRQRIGVFVIPQGEAERAVDALEQLVRSTPQHEWRSPAVE